MITVRDIDALMSGIAPKALSEEWDNDGVMLCGNLDKPVKKVLCALEATEKVSKYACENGFDLVVTHHPLIFKKLSRLDESNFDVFAPFFQNGISVLSYHTRLDSAEGGVNDCLAELIGLSDAVGFGGESGCIGRIGKVMPMSFEQFGEHLLSKLNCVNIRACDAGKSIEKVALVGGSGKDYIFDAVRSGADAFVTSEIPHHMYEQAKKLGISLFDCGHYYTENCIAEKLAELIKEKYPELCVQSFDVQSPYVCIQ